MRKDIKKRLENALITLQEPGGSTIRSIIKVINHESPVLSLRKVLEALQEGINEGFLCMYNGRFKLKQQLNREKDADAFITVQLNKREKEHKDNTPRGCLPEDSEVDTEEEEEEDDEEEDDDDDDEDNEQKVNLIINRVDLPTDLKETISKKLPKKGRALVPGTAKKKRRRSASKGRTLRKKPRAKAASRRRSRKGKRELKDNESLCLMGSSPSIPEMKACKPSTTEKPDLKKQRGPRCTSMKKDVRMPSKVHIPFVAPSSVPQKGNIFNDLARRSPDPVNGPLFDGYILENPGLNFFETFC